MPRREYCQVAASADRDIWVSAYAAWYRHFLAMQPVTDRLCEKWARNMVENTLVHFHQRNDQQEIVQIAMQNLGSAGAGATLAQYTGERQAVVALARIIDDESQREPEPGQMSLF